VKRNGKYGRKTSAFTGYLPLLRHFIFIITFITKVCHHFIFQIYPRQLNSEKIWKIQKKIVNRYGKYGRKASRIVIRYEKYGRKES
jgi:hypothetical protein